MFIFCRSIKFPALKSLASNEFSNLVQSQVTEDTVTIVFVEPKLSIDDLTKCKKANGVTCFENLNNIQSKSYFPNVASPIEGLYDVPSDEQLQLSATDDILSASGSGKVIFVDLDLAKKADDYVKHDTLIGDVFDQLSEKYRNVLVIYTGRQDSVTGEKLVRKTRQAAEPVSEPATKIGTKFEEWEIVNDNNFVIAAEKVVVKEDEKSASDDKIKTVKSTLEERLLSVTITLESGKEFDITFKKEANNWELKKKQDDKKFTYPGYIFASVETPMRCSDSLNFKDNEAKVTYSIVNSQFLPSFISHTEPITFKNSTYYVHCNGYFTPGIAAGVFVIFIFAIIMIWAITFILDINTMDKFDDPKGKTITINASE